MPTRTSTREHDRVRRAVSLGLFCGTGVGLGYLLSGVPGVELMTLNAALAGLALGPVAAAAVGALSGAIYSLGSPFGPPVPLVLAAQVVGLALAGLVGGGLAPWLRRRRGVPAVLVAGAAGVAVAVAFDLATNLAVAVAFSLPLGATLVAGAALAAVHAVVAAVAFGSLLPALAGRLGRILASGPRAVRGLALLALVTVALLAPADAVAQAPGSAAADTTASAPGPAAPADSLAAVPQDTTGGLPPAVDSLAGSGADSVAVADTTAVRAPSRPRGIWNAGRLDRSDAPRRVRGWRRPLWEPFHGSLHADLQRRTPWLPVRDGGQGAAVWWFGEPGTSPTPQLMRDGLPLQIGHRYLDDPEAIGTAGFSLAPWDFGLSAADGGVGGVVALDGRDPTPSQDLTDTRWFTGPHETYLRTLHLKTANAPWRIDFAFYELLDNEGYDFRTSAEQRYPEFDQFASTTFWGHAKFRTGRGRLTRDLGAAGTLSVAVENLRKLKKGLPVYDRTHQDLWTTRMDLDWRTSAAGRPARLAFWTLATDVDWDRDRSGGDGYRRKQEGTREGLHGWWGDPWREGRLEVDYGRWTVADTGADPDWAPAHADTSRLTGETASLRALRAWHLGWARTEVMAAGWWAEHGGWLAGGTVRLAEDRLQPRWSLVLERGGRAPRADELATAWRFVVPAGRQTVALPDRELGRENTWRAAAGLQGRVLGLDLALDAAIRRLRDGIGWIPDLDDPETGTWTNGVELDATTVRLAAGREGRFLGWIRLQAAGTWRSWSEAGDARVALPPELDWRLSVLWENHFFREDGIVQLGAFLRHRGEMADPWDLSGGTDLPAITRVDLIAGFRLVGTNLSAELVNVGGAGSVLTANAVDHGTELRWRLHWVFTH
jgi:hypothetical protein